MYSAVPDFDARRQIRLLKLHRKIPFLDVSGELVSCTLKEVPQYHAISYVWNYGSQEILTMKLNEMTLEVNANVYDIITRCSSFFREHYIWIDTVCIDQKSTSEKTLQVRTMQEIYGSAVHVLVCLGTGPASLALTLMEELRLVRVMLGNAAVPAYLAICFERRKLDFYLDARIKALQALLQHPWFRRVWVVQEVVVPRKVTFFYGQRVLSWEKFYEKLDPISGPFVSLFAGLAPGDNFLEAGSPYSGFLSMGFIGKYRKEYLIFRP